jgi:hypothetical protein
VRRGRQEVERSFFLKVKTTVRQRERERERQQPREERNEAEAARSGVKLRKVFFLIINYMFCPFYSWLIYVCV